MRWILLFYSELSLDSTRGDSVDDGQPMLRRQMAIPRRHCDRLVSGEFLNLFDGRTRHRQPRAESMTVAVPDVALNLRFL